MHISSESHCYLIGNDKQVLETQEFWQIRMVKFAKWSTSCTWWEYTHLQQCISIKRERELLTHVDALISRVSEMRVGEKWSVRDIDAFAWQKSIFCISLGYSLPFSIDFVEVFLFSLQESGREIEYERDVLAN